MHESATTTSSQATGSIPNGEGWIHPPETLAAHDRWISRFLDAALWAFENDRRQNFFAGADELNKKHLVHGNRAGDEEDVFVVRLPPHHASVRQAIDFGCHSIRLEQKEGRAPLSFKPSLRQGKRSDEFHLIIPEGVMETALEGILTIRPKTAYQVLVQFLRLLKAEPARFPVHTAVHLFSLQESDMILPAKTPEDSQLNAGQAFARATVLANPFTLIWGPPGTGKSHLICSLIDHFIEQDKTVLVTSNTNDAIDAVASRIALHASLNPDTPVAIAVSEGRVTRYGTSQKPRALGTVAYSNREAPPSVPETLAQDGCSIVTGYRLTSHMADTENPGQITAYGRDVVVIDEISTVSAPLIYAIACTAREKVVLIGDPKQIPSVFALRAHAGDPRGRRAKELFTTNCFDFLQARLDGGDRRVSVLGVQQRMFDDIALWIRMTGLYREYATAAFFEHHPPKALRPARAQAQPMPGRGGVFIDTSNFHNPVACERSNEVHADLGFRLLKYYHSLPGLGPIGIVTPYARQAHIYKDYIREHKLHDVHAGTVHAFQGGEANLIIWDTVLAPTALGDQMSLHFFDECVNPEALHIHNVAISRARAKIVVLAHLATWIGQLSEGCFLLRLAKYCHSEGLIIPADRALERMGQAKGARTGAVAFPETPFDLRFSLATASRDFMPVLVRDIEMARDSIQIRSSDVRKGPFLAVMKYLLPRVQHQRLVLELYLHKSKLDPDCKAILAQTLEKSTAIVRQPYASWRYNQDIDVVIDQTVQYAGVPALLAGGFRLEPGGGETVHAIRYVQHLGL